MAIYFVCGIVLTMAIGLVMSLTNTNICNKIFILLYFLFGSVFKTFQMLTWKCRGISKPPPTQTARVLRIRCRLKISSIWVAKKINFFATHESFEDPNVILRLPTVSLYSVTKTEAIFVQCSKNDRELTSIHSFYYQAQFLHAIKMIILPISEFHRVAKLIKEPKSLLKGKSTEHKEDSHMSPIGDIIFVYSIGRCGSTLLQQMLDVIPRTLSLSEPDSYTALVGEKMSPKERQNLLYSITIFECKRLLNKDVDRLVLKFRSQCTPIAKIISQIFPDIHLIFMYRNPFPNILSFKRAFGESKMVKVYFSSPTFRKVMGGFIAQMFKDLSPKDIPMYQDHDFLNKVISNFDASLALSYVGNCSKYIELIQEKVPIIGVKYEILLKEPRRVFATLCRHIQVTLTKEDLQSMEKVMSQDSQSKSDISRSVKGITELSVESKKMIKYVLSFHPVLKHNEPVLQDTLCINPRE